MRASESVFLFAIGSTVASGACTTSPSGDGDETADTGPVVVEVTEASFGCITEMPAVRGFHVDNLLGDVEATLAVADDLEGNTFPPGTVVQLVPQEAMVKREPGFSTATNDWEFFFLSATDEGTTIETRGTTDTVNVFGGNCFSCHAPAAAYDFVCEDDHGCDALPIGDEQFAALREADPRCD